ncbi:MAG: hypothetical protein K0S70_4083, partial [Microbacterium sp.]|nr:hypothetical protein [Microbacterium sp.]
MRSVARISSALAAVLALAFAAGVAHSAPASAHEEARRGTGPAVAPTSGPNPLARGAALPTHSAAAQAASDAPAAAAQNKVATFVMYAIPARDCSAYSQGGLPVERYGEWARLIAQTLRGTASAVIVEPDALSMLGDCAG